MRGLNNRLPPSGNTRREETPAGSFPNRMRILITGVTGFVGHHLVRAWYQQFPTAEIWGVAREEDPLAIPFVVSNFARQVARIDSGQQAPVLTVGNIAVPRDFLDVRDVVDAYRCLAAQSFGD